MESPGPVAVGERRLERTALRRIEMPPHSAARGGQRRDQAGGGVQRPHRWDGVDDLAIPAILEGAGGAFAGRVYVHSGASGAVLNVVDGAPFDLSGYSTAGAGDVYGDGTPDYVVGAPSFSSSAPPAGRVVVYSGADHSVLHEFHPGEASCYGASVSGAGDVSRDEYDDVLIGAPRADFAGEDAGRAYVYSGSDGSLLGTFDGRTDGDLLGSAVGEVGDIGGDGSSDVVVGAQGNGGAAYALSGDRMRVLHHLRPRPGSGNNFAQFLASGAGDVDADGVPDVFVGDYDGGPGDNFGTGAATCTPVRPVARFTSCVRRLQVTASVRDAAPATSTAMAMPT